MRLRQYGTFEKRYETDSPLWVRRTASANIMDTSMHWKRHRRKVRKARYGTVRYGTVYGNAKGACIACGSPFTWIFWHSLMCLSCGMVLVTTTASKHPELILLSAGPLKMPWVRMA